MTAHFHDVLQNSVPSPAVMRTDVSYYTYK